MSKQKRGMFRRMVTAMMSAMGLMGMPVTHRYPDPKLRDSSGVPRRKKKRAHGHLSHGRWSPWRRRALVLHMPPCEPGTIVYFDKLVAHFGRRRAEGYRQCIQRGFLNLLPTEQDFADNPPWEFLK